MRVLLDHSGYDLLNLGDVSMLQAAVIRTRRQWPDAVIDVVTYTPDRLQLFCPGTRPVRLAVAAQFPVAHRSKRIQIGLEQVHKMTVPHLRALPPLWRLLPRERRVEIDPTLLQAIDAADVVVAGGGGYLADPFWWHGIGVLSVLEMAQRQGKPTAMFGQGVGPLTHRGLVRMTRRVVPNVEVVGLRERVRGPELLKRLGVAPAVLRVTGDEALELAVNDPPADGAPAAEPPAGRGLGINVRVAAYAGVAADLLPVLGAAVRRAAGAFEAPVVPLPISLYPEDGEPEAIAEITPPGLAEAPTALQTPADLVAAASRCRAVLTGSYHAAVFALAQGVPAVCLVKSAYYAGKFDGLAALFPSVCSTVSLDDPALPAALDTALVAAWDAGAQAREAARRSARAQLQAGRDAYDYFAGTAGERISNR